MPHKIMPNEIFPTEFGAVIRTRCPVDHVTDEMIHQRVVAANLSAGDFVRIQCFNHERTAVLHHAEWLVYDRRSEMKRREINDREIRNFEEISFSVLRVSDWQETPAGETARLEAGKAAADAEPAPESQGNKPETEDQLGLTVKWNPGLQVHEVKDADGNVIRAFTKEGGGREAAEAFANNLHAAAA